MGRFLNCCLLSGASESSMQGFVSISNAGSTITCSCWNRLRISKRLRFLIVNEVKLLLQTNSI